MIYDYFQNYQDFLNYVFFMLNDVGYNFEDIIVLIQFYVCMRKL